MSVELVAICAVGKALDSLDPEARLRVLAWANERFQTNVPALSPTPAPAPAPAPAPVLRLAPEHDLTVDGLEELFEPLVDFADAAITEDSRMVAAEEHDLADVFESPSEPARPQLRLVAREELPFDEAVADFVDVFKRLSRECQSV